MSHPKNAVARHSTHVSPNRVIGDILIEMGVLSSAQRDEIVAEQMAELNRMSA
jgi:hypothetical protein